MILAAVVRQFEERPGVARTLEKHFVLPDTPTVGTLLRIAGEPDGPLEVVSVVIHARPEVVGVVQPPAVEVFTEYEPGAAAEPARAHGWRDRGPA